VIFNRRMLICLLLGFSSGMPLYFTIQLIPAWMSDQGVDIKTIGLFALTGQPYTWKFVWSPLLDRFVPPGGRRRGWALITQVILALSIAAFGLLDPVQSVGTIAALTVAVAFFSASQDIVLDAWRREMLLDVELGLGNSMFVNGYRLGGLVPGGLALVLADTLSWPQVHLVVAAFMGVGILTTLLTPELPTQAPPPASLYAAVVEPFLEFFRRGKGGDAWLLLAFMLLYKIGDSMATSLITVFYLDTGFTKTEIGAVAKLVGLWSTIAGGFVGGVTIARIGVYRSLWVFGVVQALCVLSFAALDQIGPNTAALGACVAAEYFGVGLGTAAFLAFLSRSTHKTFTATQYALFSSLVAVPRTVVNAGMGLLAEAVGWTPFFVICALAALPGLALLPFVAPWGDDPKEA
jgi:PAT family beta-lactamase induction signal transducer AmpG